MIGLVSWIGVALLLDQYGARRRPPRHRQWDAIVVAGCRSPLPSRVRGAFREVFAIVHHALLGGP